jgi:hypothetical protein
MPKRNQSVQSDIDAVVLDKAMEFFHEQAEQSWNNLFAILLTPKALGHETAEDSKSPQSLQPEAFSAAVALGSPVAQAIATQRMLASPVGQEFAGQGKDTPSGEASRASRPSLTELQLQNLCLRRRLAQSRWRTCQALVCGRKIRQRLGLRGRSDCPRGMLGVGIGREGTGRRDLLMNKETISMMSSDRSDFAKTEMCHDVPASSKIVRDAETLSNLVPIDEIARPFESASRAKHSLSDDISELTEALHEQLPRASKIARHGRQSLSNISTQSSSRDLTPRLPAVHSDGRLVSTREDDRSDAEEIVFVADKICLPPIPAPEFAQATESTSGWFRQRNSWRHRWYTVESSARDAGTVQEPPPVRIVSSTGVSTFDVFSGASSAHASPVLSRSSSPPMPSRTLCQQSDISVSRRTSYPCG